MRSTLEVEGGARMTFEDVSEEALTEAVSGLLASRFFISSTYKEMDKDEIAPEDPDRPSQGRAGLGPRRFRTVKNASKKAVAVAERVLADGEWHSRSEVVAGWEREGLKERTSLVAVSGMPGLVRSRRSGKAWWKLERREPTRAVDADGSSSHAHGVFGATNGVGAP